MIEAELLAPLAQLLNLDRLRIADERRHIRSVAPPAQAAVGAGRALAPRRVGEGPGGESIANDGGAICM